MMTLGSETTTFMPAVDTLSTSVEFVLAAGSKRVPIATGDALLRRGFPVVELKPGSIPAIVVERLISGPARFAADAFPVLKSLIDLGHVDVHVRTCDVTEAVLTFVGPPGPITFTPPSDLRLHADLLIRTTSVGFEAWRAGRPGRITLATARSISSLGRLAVGSEGLALTELSPYDAMLAGLLAAVGLLDSGEAASGWDVIDLAFHAKSRHLSLVEPYGPRADADTARSPPQARQGGRLITLPKPDLLRMMKADSSFSMVTESRSSNLPTSEQPIPVEAIGEFLFRALRARPASPGRGPRPYPSGGRLYEIDAYLLVSTAKTIEPGLYRYDPMNHSLIEVINSKRDALEILGSDAASAVSQALPPPLLIILAADFQAVFDQYAAMPYALVLKHVGVIMHALALAAHATGLVARPIGGGRADAFADATGLDPTRVGSVGEIAVAMRAVGPEDPKC